MTTITIARSADSGTADSITTAGYTSASYPGLGVHKTIDHDGKPISRSWNITHLGSGLAVRGRVPTKAKAVKIATWLADRVDCTQSQNKLSAAAKSIAQEYKAFAASVELGLAVVPTDGSEQDKPGETVAKVMLGKLDQRQGIARTACQGVASRQISCGCGSILDQGTITVVTVTTPIRSTVQGFCPTCWASKGPSIVEAANLTKTPCEIETWHSVRELNK